MVTFCISQCHVIGDETKTASAQTNTETETMGD